MTGRIAAILFAALSCGAAVHAASPMPEANLARKREFILADLERRASEQLKTTVVLRQQVLDAGPELSRKQCEAIRDQVDDKALFKFARDQIRQLEGRDHRGKLTADQQTRFDAVKQRFAMLEHDAPMNCKALPPLNP